MLCWLSLAAPLVLPPPQPLGCSPPGSIVALPCCCGLPRLAAMLDGRFSAVPGGVFGCSARHFLDFCCQFTPGSIAGTGSLRLLCRPPLSAQGLQRQVCFDGRCCSLRCWRRCSCSLPADWQALHLFFVCLLCFVKCPWVPRKALY